MIFIPFKVSDLLDALAKCQEDEYLMRTPDGNLISTFGTTIHVGYTDAARNRVPPLDSHREDESPGA